jgi:hypothetical protein
LLSSIGRSKHVRKIEDSFLDPGIAPKDPFDAFPAGGLSDRLPRSIARFGFGFGGSDIPAHHDGNVASAELLFANDLHRCSFAGSIDCLKDSRESLGFNKS